MLPSNVHIYMHANMFLGIINYIQFLKYKFEYLAVRC